MDDPASLAASWYGTTVIEKLKALMAEIVALLDKLLQVIENMTGPFKTLGDTMQDSLTGVNKTMKGLTMFPDTVMALSNKIKGPKDLADIDTVSMKKDLDISGMDGPLSSLEGLSGNMGSTIDSVKDGIDSLSGFVTDAPQKIKDSFAVPTPLCFITGCAMANASPAMQSMMEQVEQLKSFDLEPVVKLLQEMHDKLANIDIALVKDPAKKVRR